MPNILTGVLSGTSSIIRTQPLTATENGTYNPPSGVDGYKPVVVNVPQPQPVIEQLTATYNGIYNAPSGIDGYDPVVVNVPAPAPVLDDITITANGHYTPPTGVDGYDDITVNVPLPANAYLKQTLSGLPSPIATFTGADAPLDSLKASIVGVQSGSGDPSPSNVRPITGWTSCVVNRTGKNIFCVDVTAVDKTTEYRPNTSQRANLTKINDNSFRATGNNGAWTAGYYVLDGIDGTLDYAISFNITDNNTSYTPVFVKDSTASDENKLVLRVSFGNTSTLTTSKGATFENVQVEVGDQATTFEAYSGNTYTIPFKDSSDNPVDIYDGTIDITDGSWINNSLLEVFDNTATVTFGRTGQSNWYYQIVGTNTGAGGETAETISNMYSYANIGNDNDNLGIMKLPNGNLRVRVGGTQPATVDDFVSSLGVTPLQVVSKLATPQTGSFTPIALRSNGVTNISVNCGEVTELKYFTQS